MAALSVEVAESYSVSFCFMFIECDLFDFLNTIAGVL